MAFGSKRTIPAEGSLSGDIFRSGSVLARCADGMVDGVAARLGPRAGGRK